MTRASGIFVMFLAVATASAFLPISVGPVLGFWAVLGACLTPLVFAWTGFRQGRLTASAKGSGESAEAVRRRKPAPTTARVYRQVTDDAEGSSEAAEPVRGLKPAPTTARVYPQVTDDTEGSGTAEAMRRRTPAPAAAGTHHQDTVADECSDESLAGTGSAHVLREESVRVRWCSGAGLMLASIGWLVFVLGKMRMDIVQSGPLAFAAYSDWGFNFVRLALLLGVLAAVTLLGASGQTRLRGLTSAALLVVWVLGEAVRT